MTLKKTLCFILLTTISIIDHSKADESTESLSRSTVKSHKKRKAPHSPASTVKRRKKDFASSVPKHKGGWTPESQKPDFYNLYQSFVLSGRDCNRPQSELEEIALQVMSNALARFQQPLSDPSNLSFKEKMELRWKTLLGELKNEDTHSDSANGDERINTESLKHTLKKGIIPLPVFEDEHPTDNYFRFDPMIALFTLGVSPVSIESSSHEDFSKRIEHPLRKEFLSSRYRLADHDIQHAAVQSNIFETLGLQSNSRAEHCESVNRCLERLDLDSAGMRKALFYLFHEDDRPLTIGFNQIDPFNLLEFSMEIVVRKEKYSLYKLLLGDAPTRTVICHKLLEGTRIVEYFKNEFLEFTELVMPHLLAEKIIDHFKPSLDQKNRNKEVISITNLARRNLVDNLKTHCKYSEREGGPKVDSQSKRLENQLIGAHLLKIRESEFLKTWNHEIDSFLDHLDAIHTHLKSTPDCRKLRKRTFLTY